MNLSIKNNDELTTNSYRQMGRLLSYVAGDCSCERCEQYRTLADIVINEPDFIDIPST